MISMNQMVHVYKVKGAEPLRDSQVYEDTSTTAGVRKRPRSGQAWVNPFEVLNVTMAIDIKC